MQSKREAPNALSDSYGILPDWLVTDNAREEELLAQWKTTIVCSYHIRQTTTTEPYSPWQNRAEAEIRELKRSVRRHTIASGSPKRLWCYLLEYVAGMRRLTAFDIAQLEGGSDWN